MPVVRLRRRRAHVDQGSRGLARPSEARPQHPRALGEIRHRAPVERRGRGVRRVVEPLRRSFPPAEFLGDSRGGGERFRRLAGAPGRRHRLQRQDLRDRGQARGRGARERLCGRGLAGGVPRARLSERPVSNARALVDDALRRIAAQRPGIRTGGAPCQVAGAGGIPLDETLLDQFPGVVRILADRGPRRRRGDQRDSRGDHETPERHESGVQDERRHRTNVASRHGESSGGERPLASGSSAGRSACRGRVAHRARGRYPPGGKVGGERSVVAGPGCRGCGAPRHA